MGGRGTSVCSWPSGGPGGGDGGGNGGTQLQKERTSSGGWVPVGFCFCMASRWSREGPRGELRGLCAGLDGLAVSGRPGGGSAAGLNLTDTAVASWGGRPAGGSAGLADTTTLGDGWFSSVL